MILVCAGCGCEKEIESDNNGHRKFCVNCSPRRRKTEPKKSSLGKVFDAKTYHNLWWSAVGKKKRKERVSKLTEEERKLAYQKRKAYYSEYYKRPEVKARRKAKGWT